MLLTVREEGKQGKEEDKEGVNKDEGEGGNIHKEEVVEEGEDKHVLILKL